MVNVMPLFLLLFLSTILLWFWWRAQNFNPMSLVMKTLQFLIPSLLLSMQESIIEHAPLYLNIILGINLLFLGMISIILFFLKERLASKCIYIAGFVIYQYLALILAFLYAPRSFFLHLNLSTVLVFACFLFLLLLFSMFPNTPMKKEKKEIQIWNWLIYSIWLLLLYFKKDHISLLIGVELFNLLSMFFLLLYKRNFYILYLFIITIVSFHLITLGMVDFLHKGWILYLFQNHITLSILKLSLSLLSVYLGYFFWTKKSRYWLFILCMVVLSFFFSFFWNLFV